MEDVQLGWFEKLRFSEGNFIMPHLIAPSSSLESDFFALYSDYQKAGELEWCEAAKGALDSFPDYVRALEAEAKGEGVSDDWAPLPIFGFDAASDWLERSELGTI